MTATASTLNLSLSFACTCRGEANAHKWLYRLSETDIAEIDAALASIQEKGIKIEVCGRRTLVRRCCLQLLC